MLSPEQAAALAAGELDFGLLLPPVAGAARLDHLVGQRERFLIALPAKHRLASDKGRLALAALAGAPLVPLPRAGPPRLYGIPAPIAAPARLFLKPAPAATPAPT